MTRTLQCQLIQMEVKIALLVYSYSLGGIIIGDLREGTWKDKKGAVADPQHRMTLDVKLELPVCNGKLKRTTVSCLYLFILCLLLLF